jgi:ABC-type sugar transport system ATPase subunit
VSGEGCARAPAAPESASVLAAEGLSRQFGDAFALENIRLALDRGEYWVLLGPSGCGKSMLLQTLSGLFDADSGQIHIDGRDATREPPERRGIGLVFQQAALFPHYSVAGNIEHGLRARGVGQAERRQRVEAIVASLRLAPILSRPVATLSGGEAQRVAIARALAIRPSLLLLDEPLSLLDHNTRLSLQAEIKRIHAEHALTTLHVTHSREEALAMGDHCAVMLGGRIVQRGTTEELFARPRCPFVAQFLGVERAKAASEPACAPACLQSPARCVAPAG